MVPRVCECLCVLLDSEDDEGEEAEPHPPGQVSYNKQTMPGESRWASGHVALIWSHFACSFLLSELIVCLDASNAFLKDRVMNLPQSAVEGTHNTEEGEEKPVLLYV